MEQCLQDSSLYFNKKTKLKKIFVFWEDATQNK